jgi:hypothetical protein
MPSDKMRLRCESVDDEYWRTFIEVTVTDGFLEKGETFLGWIAEDEKPCHFKLLPDGTLDSASLCRSTSGIGTSTCMSSPSRQAHGSFPRTIGPMRQRFSTSRKSRRYDASGRLSSRQRLTHLWPLAGRGLRRFRRRARCRAHLSAGGRPMVLGACRSSSPAARAVGARIRSRRPRRRSALNTPHGRPAAADL